MNYNILTFDTTQVGTSSGIVARVLAQPVPDVSAGNVREGLLQVGSCRALEQAKRTQGNVHVQSSTQM